MYGRLLRRLREEEDGFGLMELLMSIVILSISIAALLGIFMTSAFSLARAGHQGTATVLLDRTFEYYHRAPWWDIRLVKHGPGNSGGVLDTNVTGDTQYNSTAQCNGCPAGSSTVIVDEDATTDTYGNPSGAANNSSTCNAGLVNPDPNVDSTAPLTNCLAITAVRGADGFDYRVYTYMKYACITRKYEATTKYGFTGGADSVIYNGAYYTSSKDANTGHTPSSSPTWWTLQVACPVDYSTKIVTIAVRMLKDDGTLANPTATGILAEQTVTLSFGSYTSIV
jgi:hypothetical protein